MIRNLLATKVKAAIQSLIDEGSLSRVVLPAVEITDTKQAEHGDYACNVAMTSSKHFGKNPREIGELIAAKLQSDSQFSHVDVAGPGFLNLSVAPETINSFLTEILERGDKLAYSTSPEPHRINVEFVSVNPNGPITIGSGRGAAYGSALCNILEAAGNTMHREYYINDGVNSEQMRQFAESVKAIHEGRPVPENGYKGDYVEDVARSLPPVPPDADVEWFQANSQALMVARQREATEAFGVTFDTWFSEQSLHDAGIVDMRLNELVAKGVADTERYRTKLKLGKGGKIEEVIREEQPDDPDDASGGGETLWLRSTKFGDDMDRVLRRRDGRLTYISSDIAYHADKFSRPANGDRLITIVGPDHHGYISRLQAVIAALIIEGDVNNEEACAAALAEARERLKVQIFQLVRFLKDGKPAPMRKRDGNIYALIDLITEIGTNILPDATSEEQMRVGKDVARFFYLMRSHDTTFDFDLDLAARQSDDNPVFYVQYAHARICSVMAKAAEAGFLPDQAQAGLLVHECELSLIKKVADLPYEVQRAAADFGVHRIATYTIELARVYHHFYDACRVIQSESPDLTRARLALCQAARNALSAGLALIGVSAPDRM